MQTLEYEDKTADNVLYERLVAHRNNEEIDRVCFGFALLCSDWLKTLAPLSQPSKTKTNRDLLARVFPRLTPVACIGFEF